MIDRAKLNATLAKLDEHGRAWLLVRADDPEVIAALEKKLRTTQAATVEALIKEAALIRALEPWQDGHGSPEERRSALIHAFQDLVKRMGLPGSEEV